MSGRDEAELEAAVLGGADEFLSNLGGGRAEEEEKASGGEEGDSSDEAPEEFTTKPKVLWVDEDDVADLRVRKTKRLGHLERTSDADGRQLSLPAEEYRARLRKELERTRGPAPAWAQPKAKKVKLAEESDSDSETEDTLLRRTGAWLSKSSARLPKTALRFVRLKDPTFGHKQKKPLAALHFHPSAPLLLAASETGKIQLYKLSGGESELLTAVAFENFPLKAATFCGADKVAVASGRANFLHLYDLATERSVKVHVVGPRTKELKVEGVVGSSDGAYLSVLCDGGVVNVVSGRGHGHLGQLRHNGSVRAAAQAPSEPARLFTVGQEGLVYVWDLSTRRCLHKFHDQGCLEGSALAVSPNGRQMAVGSSSGVVNVYDVAEALKSEEPRPAAVFTNLTTAVTSLVFNHTAELLFFASDRKDNAARLCHLASKTVFDSWPGKKGKLRRVQCGAFSADSAYLSMGNDGGQAVLHRLLHFAHKAPPTDDAKDSGEDSE